MTAATTEIRPVKPGVTTSEFGLAVAAGTAITALPILGVPISGWTQLGLAIISAGYALSRAWAKFRRGG